MTDLFVPDYVTEIKDYQFAGCEMLESVVIPEGVVLGDGAFSDCVNLTYVAMSGENFGSFASAFSGCPIKTVTISDGEVRMGSGEGIESGLDGFTDLSTIKLLRKVTGVDVEVLAALKNLKSIKISPNNAVYEEACDGQGIVERESRRLIFSLSKL